MKITDQFDVIKIAAFLKKNLACLHSWDREQLLTWLSWHSGRGNVTVVEEEGRIAGASVARPLYDPVEARVSYRENMHGRYVYVEQLAAKSNHAFKALVALMHVRFPSQTALMFARPKNGNRIKIYPIENFLKKAL